MTARQLLRAAATATGADYENLRAQFLDLSNPFAFATTPAGWKEAVLLEAWRAWKGDPAGCRALFYFHPISNLTRNPLPGMQSDTREAFEENKILGPIIATERLLKRPGHSDYLADFIAKQGVAFAFEVILDSVASDRIFVMPELLASFGPQRAGEIAAELPGGERTRRPILVNTLRLLNARETAPILGATLIAIPRGHSFYIPPDEYWHEEEYLGIAIVEAFETFTGERFPHNGKDWAGLGRRGAARRIDACKAWWKAKGQRRVWKRAEGGA